jgi:hypothetical protein
MPYHRPPKAVTVLLEFLERIAGGRRPFNDRSDAAIAHVIQYRSHLIRRWRVLRDVQFELFPVRVRLMLMSTGLILSGVLASSSRGLFQKCCDADRSWRACFMEERDDVAAGVLPEIRVSSGLLNGYRTAVYSARSLRI